VGRTGLWTEPSDGFFVQSGGGGDSSPATTPVDIGKSDHEAHVEFAREFVVELVENVPKKR